MRILDSSFFKADSAEKTRRTKDESRSAAGKAGAAAGPGRQDTVATQHQESLVSQVLQGAEAGRSDRVERLRAEFAAGKYQVDALELSRSLIDDAILNA